MFHDLRARSREYLRRGLLLSGAIHVALLFAFLSAQGTAEVDLRTTGRPMDIFRQPIPKLIPLPPIQTRTAPPAAPDASRGIVTPVIEPPTDFPGLSVTNGFVWNRGAGEPGPARGPAIEGEGPPNPPPPDDVYPIGKADVPPVATVSPKPLYPPIAKEYDITGRVVAHVLVRPDGTVGRVEIRSGNTILASSVEETLYRWRFRPGTVRGRPVSVWVEIPVVFTL